MVAKWKFVSIAIFAIFFISPTCALSTLISINSGGAPLVYDDVNNVYWQADVVRYTNLDWSGVLQQIQTDNQEGYGGSTAWELAAGTWELEEQSTVDTIKYFTSTSTNYDWNIFGRVSTGGDRETQFWANYHQLFTMKNDDRVLFTDGYIDDDQASPIIGAWVRSVGPINTFTVPEPTFFLFLVFSLMALVGIKSGFSRKQ